MALLDIRTIVIANTLFTAVCLAALIAIRVSARDERATALWSWSYVLLLLDWLLVAARGMVPDILSIVAANAIGIAGLLLVYLGLRRFFDDSVSQWPNYILLGMVVVGLSYFTFTQPSLRARDMLVSVAISVVCAQPIWFLLSRKDSPLRTASIRIALSFGWLLVIALARITREFMVPRTGEFMQPDTFDGLVLVAWGIGVMGLAFTLVLLVNDDLVGALQTDLDCRARTEQRLRQLSEHDELTGLLNGRAFRTRGETLLSRPNAKTVSLIYFDLDVLKGINDEFGHAAGDDAIAAFADVLSRSFRESDVIGRLGGDEFAVLTSSRQRVSPDTLLSRYFTELAAVNERGAFPYTLSASHGTASWNPEDQPRPKLQTLVTQADERMYAVKAARRETSRGYRLIRPT